MGVAAAARVAGGAIVLDATAPGVAVVEAEPVIVEGGGPTVPEDVGRAEASPHNKLYFNDSSHQHNQKVTASI